MKYFFALFVCFAMLRYQLAISSRYEEIQRYEDVPYRFNSNAASFERIKEPSGQYEIESLGGDLTDLLGSNVHFRQSGSYNDYGRRFVLQYPYDDGNQNKKNTMSTNENYLVPMKAPPELVLALAKESAARQANTLVNPLEELAKRSIVRSGDYWDAVWKEDVQMPTDNVLRSKDKSAPGIGIVKAKVTPGSKLYRLISVLQQFSPRLLYVVNKGQRK